MRVLIPVDHAVGSSGPHRNVVGSLNALGARNDVEVVLLTGRIDATEPYASAANIDVTLGFAPHDPKRVVSNVRHIRAAARCCDVVYVPTNLKSFLFAQTVRRGRRLVAGPNVTHLPLPGRQDAPGKIELNLMCDAWFEPSIVRRDHVSRVAGVRTVEYIHHAIDLEKFSPDARDPDVWGRYGVPERAYKVIFVGRDDEARKGVRQLLEAIEFVQRAPDGMPVHFVLVGKLSEQTTRRVRELSNATAIPFTPSGELARLYASSDIAVVPSSWETFGFTALEAMACGIPVVAARAGALPEVVIDGQTGILVDMVAPGSVFVADASARLAGALCELVNDPERRRALGINARHLAEAYFSESRLGEELVAILRGEPVGHVDPRQTVTP